MGTLLHAEFPHYTIIPQYPIKIARTTLFIDYYIPQLRLAFEADGRQHTEFVKHFHGDRLGFEDSRYRDNLKERWCHENSVRVIRFSYKEKITPELLRKKLHLLGNQEEGEGG